MSKIIRLTESDLIELVKRVISEQSGGNPITFSKVVDVPNMSKDQLFDLIMEWLTTAYKNISSVIQLSNKQQGLIVLKGAHTWSAPKGFGGRGWDGRITHTIKLQVKDNKFKIDMFDLYHDSSATLGDRSVKGDMQVDLDLGLLTDRPTYGDKPRYSLYQNKAWPLLKDSAQKNFDDFVTSLTTGIQNFKRDDDFKP